MTIEALECVTAGTDMPLISSMTSVVDIGASPAPKETQTTQEILIKFTEVWLETVDKDLSQWPCLCSQSYFYQLGAFYFFVEWDPCITIPYLSSRSNGPNIPCRTTPPSEGVCSAN
jgi:hypothetical protein